MLAVKRLMILVLCFSISAFPVPALASKFHFSLANDYNIYTIEVDHFFHVAYIPESPAATSIEPWVSKALDELYRENGGDGSNYVDINLSYNKGGWALLLEIIAVAGILYAAYDFYQSGQQGQVIDDLCLASVQNGEALQSSIASSTCRPYTQTRYLLDGTPYICTHNLPRFVEGNALACQSRQFLDCGASVCSR